MGNPSWQHYTYDGEGKRLRRNVNTAETWQVYGIGGELIAEYVASGSQLTKEYGYRNGQLLITAAVASTGWGAPPVIHDNPLKDPNNPESFNIKSIHITELRTAINALRSHVNMSPHTWTTSAQPGDWVTADPILEMRIAVDEALGSPSPSYTAGLAQNQPILAAHIQELRNRVLNAWNSGTGGVDVRWLIDDQLGTPRIVLDASGGLSTVTRHDYLPFGEELTAAGRTWEHGYTNSDVNRQKFTSYERDDETGLDYAHARYFASAQGRFTGVDPVGGSTDNPQSFNRYTYVGNNPLNATDPTGMFANAEYGVDTSDKDQASFRDLDDSIAQASAAYDERVKGAFNSQGDEDAAPWPGGTHDDIIAESLRGIRGVTEADIAEAQAGSRAVDYSEGYNTLDPPQAYLHAMVPEPWVTKYEEQGMSHDSAVAKATEDAKKATADFTSKRLNDAIDDLKRAAIHYTAGDARDSRASAFFNFGMAMHPIMDAFSPTHQWRVYGLTGEPILDGFRLAKHAFGESGKPSPAQMAAMKTQIQFFYFMTFSAKVRPH